MAKSGWKFTLLIAFGLLLFLWISKPPLVAMYWSRVVQLPLGISRLSLWPSHLHMRKFRVKNAHGYPSRSAFEADKTQASYQFSHVLSNPIEIDEISFQGVEINIDFSSPQGTHNNWVSLLSQFYPPEPGRKGFLVHKMLFSDISIQVHGLLPDKTPLARRIDSIGFEQIKSERGFPTKELVHALFRAAGIEGYIETLDEKKPSAKEPVEGFYSDDTRSPKSEHALID